MRYLNTPHITAYRRESHSVFSSCRRLMECQEFVVSCLSWSLVVGAMAFLLRQRRSHNRYGRYVGAEARCCPARLAWFLQEVPAFVMPLLLLKAPSRGSHTTGTTLLLCTFVLHYFHRSEVKRINPPSTGQRSPALTLPPQVRGQQDKPPSTGFLLFVVGMVINIHSDIILRRLRKPGETVYRIPYGGMFEFVSGANYLGEILEWFGYAFAVWSLPAFAFAFFTVCSLGSRAHHHHRDYLRRFDGYPRFRKALIPLIF